MTELQRNIKKWKAEKKLTHNDMCEQCGALAAQAKKLKRLVEALPIDEKLKQECIKQIEAV